MPPRRNRQTQTRQVTPPGGWKYLTADDPEAWPMAIAFDLDYTLWDMWVDTHVTPPVKRTGGDINKLTDRRKTVIEFYPEVPAILAECRRRKIYVSTASRTGAVDLARECLGLLLVPDENKKVVTAASMFNNHEIYPSSKIKHCKEIHRKTGIPTEQMILFDDERRNYDVESIGVTMQMVENGTDWKTFREGIALWRRNRGIRIVEGEKEGAQN